MGKMQRTKGMAFERDIVNWLKDHGYEAARNLTQTRDSGGDISLPRWLFECKRYAHIAVYTWLRQAEIAAKPEQTPVVVAKADYQEPIVIMRFDKFLELMNAKENQTKAFDPMVESDKARGSI